MRLFYSRLRHKVWGETFQRQVWKTAHFELLRSRQAVKTKRTSDIMKMSALSIPSLIYLCFREVVYRQTECLREFVLRRAGVVAVTCAWNSPNSDVSSFEFHCFAQSQLAHENTRGTDVHLQQVSVTVSCEHN